MAATRLDTRTRTAPVRPPAADDLLELIARQRDAHGDRAYLRDARSLRRTTFDSLWSDVQRWGAWMDEHGVARGDRVGMAIADPLDFASVFLSVIANGRWAMPMDPGTPPESLSAYVVGRRPRAMISDVEARPMPGTPWFGTDGARRSGVEQSRAFRPFGTASPLRPIRGGGAILSSSGSTGVPKLIPLHQHQLLYTARCIADHHRLTPADVGFNPLPLFHVNAEVVGLLASLLAGAGVVLDDRFHRTGFWGLVGRLDVTWINAVPAIVSRLTAPRPGESVPPSIRFIRSASAPLPATALQRFESSTGIPVVETYGMTEAASQITANPLEGPRKPGSVGLPVGIELRIVADSDGDRTEAATGEVGRVEIRGPSVDPRAGVSIDEGPGGHAGRIGGWLRTGDLGHLDADGYLYLLGRTDDVINRGGEKVFPREIEEVILEHPDVVEATVVGTRDEVFGQVPVAFLTVRGVADRSEGSPGSAGTVARAVADEVRARLAEALPRAKRPALLHVVAGLPATATGKVLRRRLSGDPQPDAVLTLDLR